MPPLKRVNSGIWRSELEQDAPVRLTILLPNGTKQIESISKFDLLLETLCSKYGFNPKEYRLKDVNNPMIQFTKASTLADFEGNPYTAEEFNTLTLKLKPMSTWNRIVGKGASRKNRRKNRKQTRKIRS